MAEVESLSDEADASRRSAEFEELQEILSTERDRGRQCEGRTERGVPPEPSRWSWGQAAAASPGTASPVSPPGGTLLPPPSPLGLPIPRPCSPPPRWRPCSPPPEEPARHGIFSPSQRPSQQWSPRLLTDSGASRASALSMSGVQGALGGMVQGALGVMALQKPQFAEQPCGLQTLSPEASPGASQTVWGFIVDRDAAALAAAAPRCEATGSDARCRLGAAAAPRCDVPLSGAFRPGDLVMARDREAEPWMPGVVTSSAPLQVRLEGMATAFSWKMVRPRMQSPCRGADRASRDSPSLLEWQFV